MSCDFMVVFASDFHKINNIEKIMMFFLLGSASGEYNLLHRASL